MPPSNGAFLSKYRPRLRSLLALALHSSRASHLTQRLANACQLKTTDRGGAIFPFVKRRRSPSIQILGYHRVNDDPGPYLPATPRAVFATQMEYLASRYTVLTLDSAVDSLRRNDVPDNALVITFDDGYRDNYLYAFPILQGLSIPATIFLATAATGSRSVLWHDRVFAAFRRTEASGLDGFAGTSTRYSLNTWTERLAAQTEVLKFLRSLDDESRSFWIEDLLKELRVVDTPDASNLMLTWPDVQDMHRAGISFGSHTVNHPILAHLPHAKARAEINASKSAIEERLGTRVTAFAYPGGKSADFNEDVKRIVRDAGYGCALTAIPGTNDASRDLFELRRGTPWETDVPGFAARMQWSKFCS